APVSFIAPNEPHGCNGVAMATVPETFVSRRTAFLKRCQSFQWCPGAGSNHRHCDFQSHALPTELPGHCPARGPGSGRFIVRLACPVHLASPSATHGAASLRPSSQITGKPRLFRGFVVLLS